jgi:FkbM family methyltransferase
VVDVGAHVGLVTLPAASVLGPGGRIVVFEPADANRRLLERHVCLNGYKDRVTVVGDLVGAEEADNVPFFAMDDATGMNTVVPGSVGDDYRAMAKHQTTLDAYCASHDLSPEIVKIDVEGAELGVLRGARGTVSRCRPAVFLSVHPRQITLLGETVEALADLIESLGYDCRHADGTEVTEFQLREYVLTPRQERP